MEAHSVISGTIAGFAYENGVLRVVFKGRNGLKAYDYCGVTAEDAGVFAQGLGKAVNYIKGKYGKGTLVTDHLYFLNGER